MTLAERPALGRVSALAILAVLIALFCIGPLAAYFNLIAGNDDALAEKAAVLQRYRALADSKPSDAAPTAGPALLYADMPESQVTALLQETVKNAASAAHVQVQGLQVLRSETAPGATRIGVRARASGDMAGLRGFLYAIESARPALYPDNLSVQSHATSPDAAPSVLDFQLDISGFKAEPQS
jgi:general secretion pathway protein M